MSMTREEAFNELYDLKGYPKELKNGLYPIFEKVYHRVLIKMEETNKSNYLLDPEVVMSYVFEEHYNNVKTLSKEQAYGLLNNSSYIDRLVVMLSDKIFFNEFLGYDNEGLITEYNPLITTYSFFLNFILNRFEHLYASQNANNAVFLDILKKGFVMSKCVLDLLSNGFETEAFSTWRTIHEVECIAKILFENPYISKTYIRHIEYARYYRNDNGDKEKQNQLFEEIKLKMKDHGLKSKDTKKFVEYGWLYSINDIEEKYQEFKPNFRKGVELIAGLSEYSPLYELSSEIAHSSPLLIYSNRYYFKSLTIINLYDTFFRLENMLYQFLLQAKDLNSSAYFNMRKDYLIEMKKNIAIEKSYFSAQFPKKTNKL